MPEGAVDKDLAVSDGDDPHPDATSTEPRLSLRHKPMQ